MSEHLSRKTNPILMRNYGRIIQDMVAHACEMEQGEERDMLVRYIAQSMRQKNATWNKDQESGWSRIVGDLIKMSNGQIRVEVQQLEEQVPPAQPAAQAGKKKRNK